MHRFLGRIEPECSLSSEFIGFISTVHGRFAPLRAKPNGHGYFGLFDRPGWKTKLKISANTNCHFGKDCCDLLGEFRVAVRSDSRISVLARTRLSSLDHLTRYDEALQCDPDRIPRLDVVNVDQILPDAPTPLQVTVTGHFDQDALAKASRYMLRMSCMYAERGETIMQRPKSDIHAAKASFGSFAKLYNSPHNIPWILYIILYLRLLSPLSHMSKIPSMAMSTSLVFTGEAAPLHCLCFPPHQRLKARFPTARGSSGHRLFISAFMIASKVICDDTYSNKSWSIVAQGMFTLREINQMEREMCNYLDWELTVDNPILADFTTMVKEDFSSSQGPYPTYPLKVVSKRAAKAASTSTKSTPIPEHNSTTSPIPIGHPSSPRKPPQSLVPPRKGSPTIDMSPDTPASSYSDTTSPATSSSPQTPIGDEDFSAKIRDNDYPLGFSITEKHMGAALKSKTFAFAVPAVW
ncbi:alternative cyclin pcl12 [Lentinula edodes]|uniref:Alternative cyclin pcl12 n=1 Tax=Lentinula edodes TaxID=5353 RepID=A0A1Q3E032_LENED|nr:alternative cyclin pcl12 [Lentinula edodes]